MAPISTIPTNFRTHSFAWAQFSELACFRKNAAGQEPAELREALTWWVGLEAIERFNWLFKVEEHRKKTENIAIDGKSTFIRTFRIDQVTIDALDVTRREPPSRSRVLEIDFAMRAWTIKWIESGELLTILDPDLIRTRALQTPKSPTTEIPAPLFGVYHEFPAL